MSEQAIQQHIAIIICLICVWITLVFFGISIVMVNRNRDDSDLHS